MASLDEQLRRIKTMSSSDLRSEWQRLFKTLPPKLSPELMRLAVAHRLQERKLGKLCPAVVRDIRSSSGSRRPQVKLKPGTRLVRSWNGRTVDVLVAEDGYTFDDRNFRSLSQIARQVTGTPWSGPRFFGLKAAAR